jgi:hypothetical protein
MFYADGYEPKTKSIPDATGFTYQFNMGSIAISSLDTSAYADETVDIVRVVSCASAQVQKAAKLITALVANSVESTAIVLHTAGASSWKLYSDQECADEVDPESVALSVGANAFYVKITSGSGQNAAAYSMTITRHRL